MQLLPTRGLNKLCQQHREVGCETQGNVVKCSHVVVDADLCARGLEEVGCSESWTTQSCLVQELLAQIAHARHDPFHIQA